MLNAIENTMKIQQVTLKVCFCDVMSMTILTLRMLHKHVSVIQVE